jgi:short-subunit dehydrogenase
MCSYKKMVYRKSPVFYNAGLFCAYMALGVWFYSLILCGRCFISEWNTRMVCALCFELLCEGYVMATALITGASSGIGLELARVCAANGVDVILSARSEDKLVALAKEVSETYQVKAEVIVCDLSVVGAAQELYDAVKKLGLDVDFLVNNAGFGVFGEFKDTAWKDEGAMLQLNIVALTHLTKLFVPDFIARGSGRILNVASTASFQPGPLMAAYFASKAYVLSFSEAISNELKGTGVTVTALCPGATATGFQDAAGAKGSRLFETRKLPTGADVAQYGYKVMMRGKRVAVHGLLNRILAQSNRFAPRALSMAITRMLIARH